MRTVMMRMRRRLLLMITRSDQFTRWTQITGWFVNIIILILNIVKVTLQLLCNEAHVRFTTGPFKVWMVRLWIGYTFVVTMILSIFSTSLSFRVCCLNPLFDFVETEVDIRNTESPIQILMKPKLWSDSWF